MRCMNSKVLVGVAAVGIGIALFAPRPLAGAGPLLILLACPLSMALMMGAMSKDRGRGCETPRAGAEAPADGDTTELTRLRAEVDRLRADVEARPVSQDHV